MSNEWTKSITNNQKKEKKPTHRNSQQKLKQKQKQIVATAHQRTATIFQFVKNKTKHPGVNE